MGKSKNVLVCIDRDGTIAFDDNYYLGRQRNWKSKLKFLPLVIDGLKLLRRISKIKIYIITNQPGVAIKEYPLLTDKRAKKVCQFIIDSLNKKGVIIDGCEVCGKANHSYVRKKKEHTFDKKLICNCFCIKPNPGMVYKALRNEGLKIDDTNIYVLGDRLSDVQTGINAGGIGILIPFGGRKEVEKVEKFKLKNKEKAKMVYIAKDFLDAVEFIVKMER